MNSVPDNGARDEFIMRLRAVAFDRHSSSPQVLMTDIFDALNRQKTGKAVGPDGIAMEAFLYGGHRLLVHIGLLFNLFIQYSYVPAVFMESKIIPLIKSKSGNLSDVNNYRAIAISTAISKLFESVIESYITSDREADQYQFGLKKTTFYCTVHQCFKKHY